MAYMIEEKHFWKITLQTWWFLLYLLDDNKYIYTAAHWIQVYDYLQVPGLKDLINQSFDLETVRKKKKQTPSNIS